MLVVLSNRGPLSWRRDDAGNLESRRGQGGLVSALAPALASTGGTWIAAALADADRQATAKGLSGDAAYDVLLLDIAEDEQHGHLDVISNEYLWYAHHDLWDRARSPSIDAAAWRAWDAYVAVNARFAEAALSVLEDAPGVPSTVLVQDYHLALVPEMLSRELGGRRADVSISHFSHTPFAPVSGLAVLPVPWRAAVVRGMAAADVCGFHTVRWAQRFLDCVASVGVDPAGVRAEVFPLGPDPEDLATVAASSEVAAELAAIEELVGDRRCVVRVDRAEPAKNVLRGLEAYGAMLAAHPDLVGRVMHLALVNPSRQSLASYRRYLEDCVSAADRLNRDHGTEVVALLAEDRFPRSVAALARADVIVVNPLSDGMNLVAKEGPILNGRDAVLVLSTEAGAHEALEGACLSVNPYDVRETSDAMHRALTMSATERAERATRLRTVATADPPSQWLASQLAALGEGGSGGEPALPRTDPDAPSRRPPDHSSEAGGSGGEPALPRTDPDAPSRRPPDHSSEAGGSGGEPALPRTDPDAPSRRPPDHWSEAG